MLYATVLVGSAFSVTFFLLITLAERLFRALAPGRRRLRRAACNKASSSRNPSRPRRSSRAPTSSSSGAGRRESPATVAARREGCSVTLLERYPYLGGLASGGMVLVLDDMTNGAEVTVTGLCMEMIERMEKVGAAVYPPPEDRRQGWDVHRKWASWGLFDFRSSTKPTPIVMAAASTRRLEALRERSRRGGRRRRSPAFLVLRRDPAGGPRRRRRLRDQIRPAGDHGRHRQIYAHLVASVLFTAYACHSSMQRAGVRKTVAVQHCPRRTKPAALPIGAPHPPVQPKNPQ